MLASLLQYKADQGGVFSDEEAAADMAINRPQDRRMSSQRDLAKRWGWSQTKVSKTFGLLALAAKGIIHDLNQNNSKQGEIEPESQNVNQNESKITISVVNEPDQKERFLSPPAPPLSSKENPLHKKKNTPKGVQKEKTFPPAETPESAYQVEIGFSPTDNPQPRDDRAAAPFSIRQAETYFQGRLDKDPTAVRKGYQSDLMAQEFFGHWDSREFVDSDGKEITQTSWKRRAATWYRNKEIYGNGRTRKSTPRNVKPRPASSKADFERIYAVALKAAGVDGVPEESPAGDFVRGGAGGFDDPR